MAADDGDPFIAHALCKLHSIACCVSRFRGNFGKIGVGLTGRNKPNDYPGVANRKEACFFHVNQPANPERIRANHPDITPFEDVTQPFGLVVKPVRSPEDMRSCSIST
jgi:hypothetical protein